MAERLQQRYFIRLAYGKGRTSARLMMTDALQQSSAVRRMMRGGFGVARRWLMLGLHPFDRHRRLQCLRVTAHWVGFAWETLMHRRGHHV
jgi:hypothetical protein